VDGAAGGRTILPLPFRPAPRPTPLFSVVRMKIDGAVKAPAGTQDSRSLGQARAEPALRLGERNLLPLGVVGELVAADPADREVPRLRVREVEPADGGGRKHRVCIRQLDPGALRLEQREELRLL